MDIGGKVEPGFEAVRDVFERNFDERGEVGARCCVYVDGRPVVDLWGGTTTADGGEPYTDTTLQMVASATKGALAIVAHRLAERGELDLDAPVARYWPEFAADGQGEHPGALAAQPPGRAPRRAPACSRSRRSRAGTCRPPPSPPRRRRGSPAPTTATTP